MWKYSMCLLFSCPKDNNKYQRSFFHAVIYPTPQVCTGRVLVAAATNEMGFRNTKTVSRPTMLQEFHKQQKLIYKRLTE